MPNFQVRVVTPKVSHETGDCEGVRRRLPLRCVVVGRRPTRSCCSQRGGQPQKSTSNQRYGELKMGQAKIRKAEIEQIKRENVRQIPLVAVHEAGHVVGRFLTANLLGMEPVDTVNRVEMHHEPDWELDGEEAFVAGPYFSEEIEAVAQRIDCSGAFSIGDEYCRRVIQAARLSGADIDGWATAMICVFVAGPAAEARVQNLPFAAAAPGAELDLHRAGQTAKLVGWSATRCMVTISNAVRLLNDRWSDPNAWRALLAVARYLPDEGRVEGRDCWKVYSSATSEAMTPAPLQPSQIDLPLYGKGGAPAELEGIPTVQAPWRQPDGDPNPSSELCACLTHLGFLASLPDAAIMAASPADTTAKGQFNPPGLGRGSGRRPLQTAATGGAA